jgi:hypothetical protein
MGNTSDHIDAGHWLLHDWRKYGHLPINCCWGAIGGSILVRNVANKEKGAEAPLKKTIF